MILFPGWTCIWGIEIGSVPSKSLFIKSIPYSVLAKVKAIEKDLNRILIALPKSALALIS